MKYAKMSIGYILIVLFWVFIIFGFLVAPKITQFFTKQQSINLFTWPLIVDPRVINQFEQETGIKVYINYYESNPELYSKIKATGGKGYDLIVPSDYYVEKFIKDGLLKKLDKSKLTFLPDLRPSFLNHYFDPGNEYSLPYFVGVYGLGINKDYFGGNVPEPSWAMLFNEKQIHYRVCMTDVPREAILLAAFYLFGSIEGLDDPKKQKAIKELLIKQKKWVQVYSDARVEELLASGSCPVASGVSADVWKIMQVDKSIIFKMPKEGGFVFIDSFVIPTSSNKDDLVYELLNFLYRPEIIRHNSLYYGFCPPLSNLSTKTEGVFCPTEENFSQLHFFKNVLSERKIHDLWISVLSY